jgi:DNA-binding GntR family transcriptional regulator
MALAITLDQIYELGQVLDRKEGPMVAARPTDLCRELRAAILRGDYAFGTRLKIDEIAQRYGVSHMPVRKALLQLEGERLVTTAPNRGASVRAVDVKSVGNTYDIVIPLEALLARRAVERMTQKVLERLTLVEHELESAVERLDHEAITATNITFHQLISEHSGNPEAAAIVDRNQELLRAFRRAYGHDAGRLPGVVADHRSLLRAFEDRDTEGAAAIAAAHAARARSDLLATIRAASGSSAGPHQLPSPKLGVQEA